MSRGKSIINDLLSGLITKYGFEGAAVVDEEGLIIVSVIQEPPGSDRTREFQLGKITALNSDFVCRVREEMGVAPEYYTNITIGHEKYIFTNAGAHAILTVITHKDQDDSDIREEVYRVADAIAGLFDNHMYI